MRIFFNRKKETDELYRKCKQGILEGYYYKILSDVKKQEQLDRMEGYLKTIAANSKNL